MNKSASIDTSLYGLTKNNNGYFKSEKQRAFLISKFGEFCADDEYIVLGSGSGVAKSTTWIDTFKLSEDRSRIVSIYRRYNNSKGAKDRFIWKALSNEAYLAVLDEREAYRQDSNKRYLETLEGYNLKCAIGAVKDAIKKYREFKAFIKFLKDQPRELTAKESTFADDSLFQVKKNFTQEWEKYRTHKSEIKKYRELLGK